jgi:hypothetical protein
MATNMATGEEMFAAGMMNLGGSGCGTYEYFWRPGTTTVYMRNIDTDDMREWGEFDTVAEDAEEAEVLIEYMEGDEW